MYKFNRVRKFCTRTEKWYQHLRFVMPNGFCDAHIGCSYQLPEIRQIVSINYGKAPRRSIQSSLVNRQLHFNNWKLSVDGFPKPVWNFIVRSMAMVHVFFFFLPFTFAFSMIFNLLMFRSYRCTWLKYAEIGKSGRGKRHFRSNFVNSKKLRTIEN